MGKKRTNSKATATSAPNISPGMDYHDIQNKDPEPDLNPCSCNCNCKEMLEEIRAIRDSTRRYRDTVCNFLEPLKAQQSQQHSVLLQSLKGYSSSLTKVTDNLANLTQFTSDLELKIEAIRNTLHDRIAAMDTAFEKFQNIVLITKPSSDSSPISPQNQVCDYDVNILLTKVSSINRELRANNVVIHGIRQDTGKETHNQALEFLKHKLNLRIQPLESKRLGKSTPEHTAPLLLKFQSRLEKLQLLKRCYLLKGTHISVQDDLCEEDRAERKRKLPNFKELKALNRNVHFRGPDLFVDNKLYPC
jgi:hypothetical protein